MKERYNISAPQFCHTEATSKHHHSVYKKQDCIRSLVKSKSMDHLFKKKTGANTEHNEQSHLIHLSKVKGGSEVDVHVKNSISSTHSTHSNSPSNILNQSFCASPVKITKCKFPSRASPPSSYTSIQLNVIPGRFSKSISNRCLLCILHIMQQSSSGY